MALRLSSSSSSADFHCSLSGPEKASLKVFGSCSLDEVFAALAKMKSSTEAVNAPGMFESCSGGSRVGSGMCYPSLRFARLSASSCRVRSYSLFLFAAGLCLLLCHMIGTGNRGCIGLGLITGGGAGAGIEAGAGASSRQSWSSCSASSSIPGLAGHSGIAGSPPTGSGLGRLSSSSYESWRCIGIRPSHCPSTVGVVHGVDSAPEITPDSLKVT